MSISNVNKIEPPTLSVNPFFLLLLEERGNILPCLINKKGILSLINPLDHYSGHISLELGRILVVLMEF